MSWQGKMVILYIDDENPRKMKEVLERSGGLIVLTATNMMDALRIIEVWGPKIDLILQDLGLDKRYKIPGTDFSHPRTGCLCFQSLMVEARSRFREFYNRPLPGIAFTKLDPRDWFYYPVSEGIEAMIWKKDVEDGWPMAEALRHYFPGIPILSPTAYKAYLDRMSRSSVGEVIRFPDRSGSRNTLGTQVENIEEETRLLGSTRSMGESLKTGKVIKMTPSETLIYHALSAALGGRDLMILKTTTDNTVKKEVQLLKGKVKELVGWDGDMTRAKMVVVIREQIALGNIVLQDETWARAQVRNYLEAEHEMRRNNQSKAA